MLREHLDDPTWVVIDCRHSLQDFSAGRKAYDAGHIPGACFADVERDLAGEKTGTNGRHPLPDSNAFVAFLRTLGVGEATQIVAYDEGGDMYAARCWFLCRWIGHDATAVLDGGISAWRTLGYPLSTDCHPEPFDARFARAQDKLRELTLHLRPELVVTADDVLAHLHDGTMRVIDARAADRFRGENESIDPVAGHIPGASNVWFKENFDGDGRLKPPPALREAYARYGDPSRVVHQCGSGVSSAVNALAMERAGLHGWRLYPGSWSEWVADPARPVERGA